MESKAVFFCGSFEASDHLKKLSVGPCLFFLCQNIGGVPSGKLSWLGNPPFFFVGDEDLHSWWISHPAMLVDPGVCNLGILAGIYYINMSLYQPNFDIFIHQSGRH